MCRPRPGRRCGDGARSALWEAKQRGMTEQQVLAERAAADKAAETRPRKSATKRATAQPKEKPSGTPEESVRQAIAAVGAPGEWVSIDEVCSRLTGMSHREQDQVLLAMESTGDVQFTRRSVADRRGDTRVVVEAIKVSGPAEAAGKRNHLIRVSR